MLFKACIYIDVLTFECTGRIIKDVFLFVLRNEQTALEKSKAHTLVCAWPMRRAIIMLKIINGNILLYPLNQSICVQQADFEA